MKLFICRPDEIDRAWKDGAHKLSEATKWAAREVTTDQLKMLLSRGERTLIGARDESGAITGWAAVDVQQLPNIRVLYIYALQGRGLCSAEGVRMLQEFARSHGCTSIRGAVRASMARLLGRLGARPIYQTVEWEVA